MPKELRTFCKHCGKHTPHVVSISKGGKQRASSLGARRHAEDRKGYGGQKFPKLVRTAKTTKKITLKIKCTICSKSRISAGMRLRKAEIVA
ncbi:MAG: 50S ribosomal protein L44e [Thaumarchaeota archaeon]|nr:50S ribosomal protein L44e [Nitrososphaerota archaeon]